MVGFIVGFSLRKFFGETFFFVGGGAQEKLWNSASFHEFLMGKWCEIPIWWCFFGYSLKQVTLNTSDMRFTHYIYIYIWFCIQCHRKFAMLSSRFPAGFGAGSQQSLIFVRCNNYIGESCDDLLGATARNSVCRTSTCSQNFARVSARLFSILPAPERGRPKLGSVKLNSSFGGTVLGSTFGPCFQFPQVSQKCANCWTRPTKFWRQEHSQARSQGPQWQVIIQDLFLKIWDAVVNKLLLLTSAMQLWWNQTQAR